ncbi:MAG TPA: M20/M25/M40 family metallo-hydrolase [Pyrinomonadaceae bacterium]|nr:M20/M25/M40 family metallo-hydrolase [Pyrinomonadaceae bacterium]
MKKQIFSFLLLLSFVVGVSAQTAKPTEAEANIRKHLVYLASDQLEGRRTGETGATSAAGYVANMFAQYKLKPGISQTNAKGKSVGNFLQPFPYISGVSMADSGNTFTLDVAKNDGQKMTFDGNAGFKPVGFSPNGEIIDSQIVFVGYGVSAAEQNYDDYKNLDVRGKVVIAFDGTPDSGNPRSPFQRFNAYAKAKIAKDKGASGLLLITREKTLENDPLAVLKYDQTTGEAALPTLVVSRKTAADIFGTSETKVGDIEKILSANGDAAFRVIVEINTKAIVGFKVNLVKKQTEAYNVIGILEGNDPVLKNEAIVIGAHYDHLGKGGQGSLAVNSTEIHHGADDNASGTSALIELARQFAKEKKNKRTIIFISFGGEEEGLLGSKFYVNNPIFPLDKTVAMFNMDMIGRLREEKLNVGGIGSASEWKNLVEVKVSPSIKTVETSGEADLKTKQAIENALREKSFTNVRVEIKDNRVNLFGNVPKGKLAEAVKTAMEVWGKPVVNYLAEGENQIFSFNLQLSEDGFGPSDHASFYGKQIPVLFFFTGTHEDYHKPSDTSEKINYAGVLKIANYVSELVKTVDANATKPTYKVAQSSGTGEGRRSFNVSLGTVPGYGDSTDGMLIDGVRTDSPADKAGLKSGDKIVKLAGKDVRNVQDYMVVLGDLKAGEEYEIVIMRNGEKMTMKIIPAPAARRQ